MKVSDPVFPIEHSDHDAKEDRDNRHVLMLLPSRSVGGKIQSRERALSGQPRVRIQYLVDCFPSRKFFQDELNSDACGGDDRFTHHYRRVGLN
jgi:hypothetical protein